VFGVVPPTLCGQIVLAALAGDAPTAITTTTSTPNHAAMRQPDRMRFIRLPLR